MVVIGSLGSAETCGNDVTNLVGLARALINETVTGIILHIHVNARLPQYDRRIGERHISIVGSIEHVSPAEVGGLGETIKHTLYKAHFAILS